jgi:hypothetical protein
VGHVQKKVRNRVEALKKKCAAKRYQLKNGKMVSGLGGRFGITDWAVKRIQGHHGGVIRKVAAKEISDAEKLAEMKKRIMAIYYHRKGDHSTCSDDDCPAAKHPGDAEALKRANHN